MAQKETFRNKSRCGANIVITLDNSRDDNLTNFGKATLDGRYLLEGESYQRLFGRVATYFSKDAQHAQRLYDYMSQLWFMPSTPVLSNGGTDRGMPISCFLNSVEDSLEGIAGTWDENVWLAARGGGIGTYWGNVRSIGEKIGDVGETSGVVPFIKVQDSLTLGISQGSLRRGSAAVYLDVSHPEIEEFIDIRNPMGDSNRRSLNIHHGVNIPDAFMEAVRTGDNWDLISPKTGEVVKTVKAREIWRKMLVSRIKLGEPYFLFIDTVNAARPDHQKALGLEVKQSNLCSEITLPTGVDHLGKNRTAVCCLSSLNAEKFMEWNGNEQFLRDVLLFNDEVLEDFIERTEGIHGFENARYSAMRERSIGVGLMGFHSLLQSMGTPMEGAVAKSMNRKIFRWMKETGDKINIEAGAKYGACPDAAETGRCVRWSNMYSIAPTASISIICGTTSPGTEPISTNIFTQKTLSGSFTVRNKYLANLLEMKRIEFEKDGVWVEDQWSRILANKGSVQGLEYLNEYEKACFKTAFEIDQRWLVEHAADRTPFICQSQSFNVFIPGDANVRDLHHIHFSAWEKGVKSMYYCRSTAVSRANNVGHIAGEMPQPEQTVKEGEMLDYDECLVCQ